MSLKKWLLSCYIIAQCYCSNLPVLPSETATTNPVTTINIAPTPTDKPGVGELLKRQAYFSTCGYYSGTALSCSAGYVCATNNYNYAGCCPMNNLAACTIPISCVDYSYYSAMGSNAALFGTLTGICTNPAWPSCYEKLWNYATVYTELACGPQRAYYQIDPNPAVSVRPAAVQIQPAQSPNSQVEPDPNTSGQNIDGNQNSQISGNNNIINYGSDGEDHGGTDNNGGKKGLGSRSFVVDMFLIAAVCLSMTLML